MTDTYKRKLYTEEQNQFLRDNISQNSYTELRKKFNEKFDRQVTTVAIEHKCKKLGINHGHKGVTFIKGENNPFSPTLPIGSETISARKVYVKVSDKPVPTGKSRININWVQKNRYVYEQAHGKLLKNYQLIALDGNRRNFDLDNLYAVPRKIGMMLGANKWFSSNREVTLAAIKYCELFYALKEVNN